MIRPAFVLGALGALLASTSAHALEAPAPGPRDKRVRVVAYDPDDVVQLYAAAGSTVRIAIAPDETVEALLVSDQGVMSAEVEAESSGGDPGQTQSQTSRGRREDACSASFDTNMVRSVCGPYIYIKPLRDLEPQPLHIQAKRKCVPVADGGQPKCEWRAYQFELLTRPGPLTEGTPNTFYSVRFDYPADRIAADQAAAAAAAARARAAVAARQAAARARWQENQQKAAEAALRAQQGAVVNKAYTVQGDRAVLGAPK